MVFYATVIEIRAVNFIFHNLVVQYRIGISLLIRRKTTFIYARRGDNNLLVGTIFGMRTGCALRHTGTVGLLNSMLLAMILKNI